VEVKETNHVYELAERLSSRFNSNIKETAIILAAGHGKRIKSQRSKMLHKIWEVPTVERVYNACKEAIKDLNIVIVVGIKAKDVIELIGKRDSTIFAYQEFQNGTGHAVQVALDKIENKMSDGIVYVLPGDMGLIDKQTMNLFREEFLKTDSDMMVLTGLFEGDSKNNSYGRIIRVKELDEKGKCIQGKYGEYLRHPFSGVSLAEQSGVPAEVCHIIAAHAGEGDLVKRSTEAYIVHHADFMTFLPFMNKK